MFLGIGLRSPHQAVAVLLGVSDSDTEPKIDGRADVKVSKRAWLFATARYDLVARRSRA